MNEQHELEVLLEQARIDAPLASRLARYGALVLAENRRFNLTGAKTPQAFAPHLIDSLSVLPYVSENLVDIGSGAGLPAIPIALACGIRITMVETTLKKARFLESMLEEFSLAGNVIAERAETAARRADLRDGFSCATARAVSNAATVAELLLPFLKSGGVGILQRAAMDRAECNALADAAGMLAGRVAETISLDGERRIILVQKTGPTPERFPRRTGIPEKRPLCMPV